YHGYIRLWQHDQYVLADASGNILARQDQFRFGPGLPSGDPSLWYQHVGNMWVAVAETGEGNDKQIRFLWKGRLYDMPGGSDVARNGGPRLRFSDGLMAVRRDGKFGYLDVDGNEALPFAYEAARTFSSGKAYVRQDGKWRIINRDGTRLRHFDVMYAFLVKGDTRD
ncbi:MAG TPA: WG repeat-containing protein, partial [Oleiagrimonas sp.]|nr:WG repeat-containing protein [Oleiagrimonas sp.]